MLFPRNHNLTQSRLVVCLVYLFLAALTCCGKQTAIAEEHLSQPASRVAPNGAIHYQHTILYLTAVDPAKREVLQKPIWEIVTPTTSKTEISRLNDLFIESRHAIRAALVGAEQPTADFGLDLRQGPDLLHASACTVYRTKHS